MGTKQPACNPVMAPDLRGYRRETVKTEVSLQGESILAAQDIPMSMSESAAVPLLIHYLDAVVTLTR